MIGTKKKGESKTVIRKIIRHCGKYGISSPFIQVSYFPFNANKKITTRQRKHQVSTPKQRELNTKRAKRYLEALIYANFGKGDLRVDLTYSPENMPNNEREAKKEIQNFIKRINYKRKKLGYENAKYIVVTEIGKNGKIHHHLIMDSMLDRDTVEEIWGKGWANTRRLQPDSKMGMTAIIRYLVKDFRSERETANRRKWESSQNLVKPWETVNDEPRMMSKKKMRLIKELPEDCEDIKKIIEQDNPNYELMEVEKEYREETGTWHYFCRMKLKKLPTDFSTYEHEEKEKNPKKKNEKTRNRGNPKCRMNPNRTRQQKTYGERKPKKQRKDTRPP